jgi:hypothetical protein
LLVHRRSKPQHIVSQRFLRWVPAVNRWTVREVVMVMVGVRVR